MSQCFDILSVSYTSCCTPHYVSDGCSLVSFEMFCFHYIVKSTHREGFAQSSFKDKVTLMMPCGFKDLRCKGAVFVSILQYESLLRNFMTGSYSTYFIIKVNFNLKAKGCEILSEILLYLRERTIEQGWTIKIFRPTIKRSFK